MILCRVCHKIRRSLNNSHLATHDLTPAQYKRKFRVKYTLSRKTRTKIGLTKIGNHYNRGRKFNLSPARKALYAKIITRFNSLPSTRRKRRAQLEGNRHALGLRHSKAFKKRFATRIKQLWADPAYRKRVIHAMRIGRENRS
jgi:hypothetical protein